MNEKKLDNSLLYRADIRILQAIAETIIKSMIDSNGSYNEKLYGPIDNYKTWSKSKMIKWLSNFDLKLGDQVNKTDIGSKKDTRDEKENTEIENLKKQIADLEKAKQNLEEENKKLKD